MGHILGEGLSFGVNAGTAIFLDVDRDRYFCLSPDLNTAFLGLVAQNDVEPQHVLALIARGIICEASSASHIGPVHVPVAQKTLVERSPRYTLSIVSPATMFDRIYIHYALRRRPLSTFLTPSQAHLLHERSERDASEIARNVEAVRAAARIFGSKDQCLVQALMIRRRLHRQGLGAALVFGVRLLPFEAHCWLQRGATVLDDHHEHVAQFTPVFVS